MPDDNLSDLSSFGTEVADRVDPPAFGSLVHRARTQRRRQGFAATAAVAVVVLGIGIGVSLAGRGQTPAPPVDRPSPSVTHKVHDESTVRQFINNPKTIAGSFAVDSSGDVIATYHRCDKNDRCRDAYAVGWASGGDDLGMSRRAFYDLYPLHDGFLLMATGHASRVITESGTSTPVVRHDLADVQPGDVAVGRNSAPWLFRENAGDALFPAPLPTGVFGTDRAAVGEQGQLFLITYTKLPGYNRKTELQVLARETGSPPHHWVSFDMDHGNVAPGAVTVNGKQIVAFSSYDGATVAPVGTILLSDDNGHSVTELRADDVPFDTISSVAVTGGGSAFFSDVEGGVWRVPTAGTTKGGPITKMTLPRVDELSAVGDRVYALSYEHSTSKLLVSDDGGGTWSEVTLPGR